MAKQPVQRVEFNIFLDFIKKGLNIMRQNDTIKQQQ